MPNHANILKQVEAAMDTIRPFLNEDGGDLELVEISEELVATVRFVGSCKDCSMNEITFKSGVEGTILQSVPEIKAVELEH